MPMGEKRLLIVLIISFFVSILLPLVFFVDKRFYIVEPSGNHGYEEYGWYKVVEEEICLNNL